jgi:glycolate oxidase iron-sulfur subunit
MTDLRELAKMLMELDDQMVSCMKCGMCQAVCPVFAETGKEADVTRGKIALVEDLAHEMVKDPEGVKDSLNKCLLCGSCAANCPSGVNVMQIFLKARAVVNGYMGLSASKKAIFRKMLANPSLFNTLTDMASKFQGMFTKPVGGAQGTSCARFQLPGVGDRHFKGLEKRPLHKRFKLPYISEGDRGVKVLLFPGCVLDKIYPDVAESTMRVLEHFGVSVVVPDGLACCGIPALSAGDAEGFNKLVKINLGVMEKYDCDYIVTACATCTATMHEFWPKHDTLLSAGEKARVEKLSAKTMDVHAFLVDVLKVDLPESKEGGPRVTYHDPCHLKKSLGVSEQPRAILKSCPVEFVEMAEADRCCGSGGSFTLYHYDVSKKIGDRKAKNIEAVNPEIVATGCPACMMQLTDALSQHGANVTIKHVMEVFAEALGQKAREPAKAAVNE